MSFPGTSEWRRWQTAIESQLSMSPCAADVEHQQWRPGSEARCGGSRKGQGKSESKRRPSLVSKNQERNVTCSGLKLGSDFHNMWRHALQEPNLKITLPGSIFRRLICHASFVGSPHDGIQSVESPKLSGLQFHWIWGKWSQFQVPDILTLTPCTYPMVVLCLKAA
jgi:hypothetical protein